MLSGYACVSAGQIYCVTCQSEINQLTLFVSYYICFSMGFFRKMKPSFDIQVRVYITCAVLVLMKSD